MRERVRHSSNCGSHNRLNGITRHEQQYNIRYGRLWCDGARYDPFGRGVSCGDVCRLTEPLSCRMLYNRASRWFTFKILFARASSFKLARPCDPHNCAKNCKIATQFKHGLAVHFGLDCFIVLSNVISRMLFLFCTLISLEFPGQISRTFGHRANIVKWH